MHNRFGAALAALVLLFAAACTDGEGTPVSPPGTAASAAVQPGAIPTRAQEHGDSFAAMSDAQLWRYVEASDRAVIVGLKAPGAPRGVWKGRVLVDRAGWSGAHGAVLAHRGVSLLSRDTFLPRISVRVDGPETLAALRRLAVVDYVEPVRIFPRLPGAPASRANAGPRLSTSSGSGCASTSSNATSSGLDPWTEPVKTVSPGDVLPWNYEGSRISEAWRRATGSGITVGLTDTGIYQEQGQFSPAGFTAGWSSGRTLVLAGVADASTPYDQCGHGTRMAGVIAAPRDGVNIVGVAWKANLVSVRQANSVAAVSAEDAAYAIRYVVGKGARIVTMAWESLNWMESVSDEIRYHHERGVLFVAAAGTYVEKYWFNTCLQVKEVIFPAEMEEVVAVTGLDGSGYLACGVAYGPEVDLAAMIDQPTTGRYTNEVVSLKGSSDATAVVSGVAALVWSAHPDWTRDQVREQLYASTGQLQRGTTMGWGLVNAYKALGGFTSLTVSAPEWVKPGQQFTVTAHALGDGPFTYLWKRDGQTQTTRTATYTAPLVQGRMSVSVTVTDTRESYSRSASATILVQKEPPPEEDMICDPNDYLLKQYC